MADGSMPVKSGEGEADEPLITLAMAVREIDLEKRTAWFVASTDAVDTYGEIVDQDSWELDIYLSNPVVLFAHKSRELPIGQSLVTRVKSGKLECQIQFAEERHNPEAERVWNCVKDKYLRAVSVGFIPTHYKWEKRDGAEVFVLYGNSLREISVTPVPANHEALAKMRARAMAERSAKNDAPSAQENQMDQATKDALAAKDLEIKTASEKLESMTKSLADLGVEAKAAKDALDVANKAAESLKSVIGCKADESLEDGARRLVEERDALSKEKADLTDKATERDVDDLIGVKITPAQKDSFLALAKKDRETFDNIVKDLADLNLTKQIVNPKAGQAPADDVDLVSLMNESEPSDGTEPTLESLMG